MAECGNLALSATCRDTHPFCPQLHSKCETEAPVRNACKKTCDSCQVEQIDQNCFDKNKDICSRMADCDTEEYQFLCPQTCKSCSKLQAMTPTVSTCRNLSPACNDPAVRRQCASNLWIRENCRISCGTCGGSSTNQVTDAPTMPTSAPCVDKFRNCASWAPMCKTRSCAELLFIRKNSYFRTR